MFDVSRETYTIYKKLLTEWNKKFNLVQSKTLDMFFERHITDSLQLLPFIENPELPILDIGSGAGFPGMVLAMQGCNNVTLVESNYKKTLFLNKLAVSTNTKVTIINSRIETLEKFNYKFVSARALAELDKLLNWMDLVSRETSQVTGLFLKGEKVDEEIKNAQINWHFDFIKTPSSTHPKGCILKITNLKKVNNG